MKNFGTPVDNYGMLSDTQMKVLMDRIGGKTKQVMQETQIVPSGQSNNQNTSISGGLIDSTHGGDQQFDEYGMPLNVEMVSKNIRPQQQIIEHYNLQPRQPMSYANPSQSQGMGGNIDYNYIKHLIKEAVTEVLSDTLLTESSNLRQIKVMKDGNMRMLTADGNVYDTKFEYKGKIKKK